MVDVEQLQLCLNIPGHVWNTLEQNSNDEEEMRQECIHYYWNYSPDSLWSWHYLGGELHYQGEETALEAAKAFIQRAPGTCGCGMCMY